MIVGPSKGPDCNGLKTNQATAVIPAKAESILFQVATWIPAFAGMTTAVDPLNYETSEALAKTAFLLY